VSEQPDEELRREQRKSAAETMPEIWRFAPLSPYMNISPPITIATSASDRANGPVNVRSRLLAARSQGDWADASVWAREGEP
jgi:hypothetical protein